MKKFLSLLLMCFILILPTQTLARDQLFTDVTDVTQNEILRKIVAAKIMSGYSDGTFEPSSKVTRGELATYISKAYKLYAIRPETTFVDVSKNHSQYDAIQALYRAGLIDGNNGYFNPNSEVKRAHIAKIFANLLKLSKQTTTQFKDILATDSNNGYIGALVKKGIIVGYPDSTFRPYQSVTRMQTATFLYRSLYGKEKQYSNRKITSNMPYAPTKVASANLNINWNGIEGEHFTSFLKFDSKGATIRQEYQPYFIYSTDGIFGSVDGTDAIIVDLDLRNLVEFKPQKRIRYMYGESYTQVLTAYFNQTIYVNKMKFTGVTKIVVTNEGISDSYEEYYFKEGYGLLKSYYKDEEFSFSPFEIASYKTR